MLDDIVEGTEVRCIHYFLAEQERNIYLPNLVDNPQDYYKECAVVCLGLDKSRDCYDPNVNYRRNENDKKESV